MNMPPADCHCSPTMKSTGVLMAETSADKEPSIPASGSDSVTSSESGTSPCSSVITRSALVVGMGTGMTAGSLLDLPTLEHLEVVEISRVMSEHGAAFFDDWNGGLLQDPRTKVVIADGRHHLARSSSTYDLVTSDPIHPWTAGSSDLYAFEHFEHMRSRLAPGGIASQWLPLYQLSDRDVRTVVATWRSSPTAPTA